MYLRISLITTHFYLFRCDGTQDCNSGEDEVGCQCEADQFKCNIGGGCIMSSKICDGYFDCPDSSDEWDCFVTFEGGSVKAR